MAMKNDQQGFTSVENLPGMDPAVESLLGSVQRRQTESHLPRSERSQKKKERERAQKRLAKRINLDLPVDLKKRLEYMARKEGVPVSQLVAFLLFEPVLQLEQKAISLWSYKIASGCPKFEYNLELKRRAEEVSRKT